MEDILVFLKTWGRIFRQAFEDNPNKTYLNGYYRTCVDVFQTMSNKPKIFNMELVKGLNNVKEYFLYLENEGTHDPIYYDRAQYCELVLMEVEKKENNH